MATRRLTVNVYSNWVLSSYARVNVIAWKFSRVFAMKKLIVFVLSKPIQRLFGWAGAGARSVVRREEGELKFSVCRVPP